MSRQIFSNGAVSRLSRTLAPDALKAYVQDAGMFPHPIPGEEFFYASLAGACEQKVEIVRVVQNCGDCLVLDRRGEQGTQAQAFVAEDMCYHAITAASMQAIMDSWSWYLGAFCPAPTADNTGEPLEDGMLYYNTCTKTVMVWKDGHGWAHITTPAPTLAAAYTYLFTKDQVGPFYLPALDIYGHPMMDLDPNAHLVEVFYNGIRQPETVDDTIMLGEFSVDWNLNKVLMRQSVPATPGVSALIEVIIHYVYNREDILSYYSAHDKGHSYGYS